MLLEYQTVGHLVDVDFDILGIPGSSSVILYLPIGTLACDQICHIQRCKFGHSV